MRLKKIEPGVIAAQSKVEQMELLGPSLDLQYHIVRPEPVVWRSRGLRLGVRLKMPDQQVFLFGREQEIVLPDEDVARG